MGWVIRTGLGILKPSFYLSVLEFIPKLAFGQGKRHKRSVRESFRRKSEYREELLSQNLLFEW